MGFRIRTNNVSWDEFFAYHQCFLDVHRYQRTETCGSGPLRCMAVTSLNLFGNIFTVFSLDRKSTRLNSSHSTLSRMPSSA